MYGNSSCFPSSNSSSSCRVITFSFPFKDECFLLYSTLQENANIDLFERCPLRTKGYLRVKYSERHLCGTSSVFKSGPLTAMVCAEKYAVVEKMRKEVLQLIFTSCLFTCCQRVIIIQVQLSPARTVCRPKQVTNNTLLVNHHFSNARIS